MISKNLAIAAAILLLSGIAVGQASAQPANPPAGQSTAQPGTTPDANNPAMATPDQGAAGAPGGTDRKSVV